jgi:hypothetical protein
MEVELLCNCKCALDAVAQEHISCLLKYKNEWNENLVKNIVITNKLRCLDCVIDNNFPIEEYDLFTTAIYYKKIMMLMKLQEIKETKTKRGIIFKYCEDSYIMYQVIKKNFYEGLKYLLSKGYCLDEFSASLVVSHHQNIKMLKMIVKYGGVITNAAVELAIKHNAFECFKFILSKKPVDEYMFTYAITVNKFEIFVYLYNRLDIERKEKSILFWSRWSSIKNKYSLKKFINYLSMKDEMIVYQNHEGVIISVKYFVFEI